MKNKQILETRRNVWDTVVQSPVTQAPSPKKSKSGIFSFLFTFAIFFILLLGVLNFSAYQTLVSYYLFGSENSSLQELITNSKAKNELEDVEFMANADLLEEFNIMPPDNRIVIPKINKNVPILDVDAELFLNQNWDELESAIQQQLKSGVVHYPHTAKPYQQGNVFLTGHSSYYPWDDGRYKDVFVLLTVMEVGDEFMIYYNSHRYKYEVSDIIEVDPSEVDHLAQESGQYEATLMTCVPPGTDLRRLLVIGDLKEVI